VNNSYDDNMSRSMHSTWSGWHSPSTF